jgi:galactosamine-6-phosphate isomerase
MRDHGKRSGTPLKLERARDYDDMSRLAAQAVLRDVRKKPGLLVGIATGDSPTGTYERLARARKTRPSLFARTRLLVLDEWIGLAKGHPVACATYVRERIMGPLGIPESRRQGFRSNAPRREAECRRVGAWLERNGPVDLCILGLGRNGHLLMNEPAAAFEPSVHVAVLAASTRRHPTLRAHGFEPRHGYTLGLGDVLRSRRILLLVSGRHKRAALRAALAGRVTPKCPASFLWLHPDVTVIADRAACP